MSQLHLFASTYIGPAQRPPDLEYIRKSLNGLLRLARNAQIMPWSEGEATTREKLFPELAASLPADEADTLTSEFKKELSRLRTVG